MTGDMQYWELGRVFLDTLVASTDENEKVIVRLLKEYVNDDWQSAIGLLLFEPTRTNSFMELIRREKYKRVITALRSRLATRKKEKKRTQQRLRRAFWAAAAVLDTSPIDR